MKLFVGATHACLVGLIILSQSCSSVRRGEQKKSAVSVAPADSSRTEDQATPKASIASHTASQVITQSTNQSEFDRSEIQKYVKTNNWAAIEAIGIARLQNSPKDVQALNLLGLASYYQKKPLAAKYYFNKVLELSPNNGAALNNLGLVAKFESSTREAIQRWRQSYNSENQKSLDAQVNMVVEFAKAKDYRKILGAVDKVDPRRIENLSLLVNLGIGYMATSQYGLAEKVFQRASEIEESNPILLINYAILNIEHEQDLDLGRRQLDRLSFLGVQSDMQVTVSKLEKKLESIKSK